MTDDTIFHTLSIHGQDIEKAQRDIQALGSQIDEFKLCKLFTSYSEFEKLINGFQKKLSEIEHKAQYATEVSEMANNNVRGLGQQFISALQDRGNVCPYHKGLDNAVNSVNDKYRELKAIIEKIESSRQGSDAKFKERLISMISEYIIDNEENYYDY